MPARVIRPVKLFVAGSYPDKGIDVSRDDLDRIVAGTREVPLRIEHITTPFDGAFGSVKDIRRSGNDLVGNIDVPDYVWALMEAANAKKVSVGIKKSLDGLSEVSVVTTPRVPSAAIFADTDDLWVFSATLDSDRKTEGGHTMPEMTKEQVEQIADTVARKVASDAVKGVEDRVSALFSEKLDNLTKEVTTLNTSIAMSRANDLTAKWLSDGRITDDTVEMAKGILLAGGESAETYIKFMESQPAKSGGDANADDDPDVNARKTAIFSGMGLKSGDDDGAEGGNS